MYNDGFRSCNDKWVSCCYHGISSTKNDINATQSMSSAMQMIEHSGPIHYNVALCTSIIAS